MEKLLNSISTRLKYIFSNTNNKYIDHQLEIIEEKLTPIKEHTIKTQELLDDECDRILKVIDLMKRVNGETNMVYKKMDELAGYIAEIKTEYFK